MHGYIVGWCRHSSIHEGEKGGKNIQMEKIERTDTQTHEKIMNKSANNQLIKSLNQPFKICKVGNRLSWTTSVLKV